MAKFIKILAASVGGGLLLGAGIRLGEAIVGRDPAGARGSDTGGGLETRLGALEDRLVDLETTTPSTKPDATGERQTDAAAAIRAELAREEERVAALGQVGAQLRVELQVWLEQHVGSRMADVAGKLRAESDEARKEMLDAFAESVQTRVTQRITRLEEEVASQSTAMAELRDCSFRTEQNLQKLLGGLDRILVPQPDPPQAVFPSDEEAIGHNADLPDLKPRRESPRGTELELSAEESLSGPVVPEGQPSPRRWSLFG